MDYLLFHNDVYLSDSDKVKRIEKGLGLKQALEGIDKASICLVDVDVELASAPQAQNDKKDSMLARKFCKLHPTHEYILQDEKIDDNIFQVIGVKTEKLSEIYSLIPSEKVEVFIPYAVALRCFLLNNGIDLSKGTIFIDDLGSEKLITVFSGLKFSVTRTLSVNEIENILPEIKRSQIGFSKKIEEFDDWKLFDLTVLTNDQAIADHLVIKFINVEYPAIEGLKIIKSTDNELKFLLPEEIKSRKRKQELKEKAMVFTVSLLILGSGLGFALLNKIKLALITHEYTQLSRQRKILVDQLSDLDVKIYREDLKQQKFLNYATPYFKILNILPVSYTFNSFRYYQTDHWNLDAYVFSDVGESFDDIPRLSILKNAVISDYFIKDNPGKRIQIEL